MCRIWYNIVNRGKDVKNLMPYKVTIPAPSFFNLTSAEREVAYTKVFAASPRFYKV